MTDNSTNLDFCLSYPKSALNPNGDPLPTQSAFHQSKKKYRLLAGGFGTGKTTSLVMDMLLEACYFENNYILLGRKDLMELKSTTLKEFFEVCPEQLILDHNKQDRIIRLINGTEIFYTNLDESIDASNKIKSLNLGACYIDQLEEIRETVFLAVQGRLRRKEGSRNFAATCNPSGHDWIYRRWKENSWQNLSMKLGWTEEEYHKWREKIFERINRGNTINTVYSVLKDYFPKLWSNREKIKEAIDAYEYQAFEATTLENIYLPSDYIQGLLSYPQNWVNRYVYCSWEDFEGTVYSEFKENIHTETGYIPNDGDEHYIVLDYGFRNPTAILFIAVDYDGIIHIYDEYYESGKLVSEIAAEIKKNKYWNKATKLADPSIYNKQRDAKSIGDEFIDNDVTFLSANNDVIQGINKVNQLFKDDRVRVSKRCLNFFKEIGSYKWKAMSPGLERNEFEEPIKKDDHLMDGIRYFANYIHTPVEPVKKEEAPDYKVKKNKKKKHSIEGI